MKQIKLNAKKVKILVNSKKKTGNECKHCTIRCRATRWLCQNLFIKNNEWFALAFVDWYFRFLSTFYFEKISQDSPFRSEKIERFLLGLEFWDTPFPDQFSFGNNFFSRPCHFIIYAYHTWKKIQKTTATKNYNFAPWHRI